LKRIIERNASRSFEVTLEQRDLCEQFTKVMQAVSQQSPLLIFIDDLQWADPASIGLLFHLGRRIRENRILLICVHRPIEEFRKDDPGRHPLANAISELKRIYGDNQLDLSRIDESERMAFVNAFLNTEPNTFNDTFRDELYRHTGGHPLFTIELLRALEARGDIVHNKKKQWMAAPSLDWSDLPARVEEVVEERVSRLGEDLLEVLTIGSVEGEKFTAEVSANILNSDIREILSSLSRKLDQ
jgi:predicted ATPase